VLGERFHRVLDREELAEVEPQAELEPEVDTETAETKAETDTARQEAGQLRRGRPELPPEDYPQW
jgi:hypothetical protein